VVLTIGHTLRAHEALSRPDALPGKNMLISSLVKQRFQASPSKLAHEHRPKLLRRSSDLCPFTHRC
jgi:hypothetical protein